MRKKGHDGCISSDVIRRAPEYFHNTAVVITCAAGHMPDVEVFVCESGFSVVQRPERPGSIIIHSFIPVVDEDCETTHFYPGDGRYFILPSTTNMSSVVVQSSEESISVTALDYVIQSLDGSKITLTELAKCADIVTVTCDSVGAKVDGVPISDYYNGTVDSGRVFFYWQLTRWSDGSMYSLPIYRADR